MAHLVSVEPRSDQVRHIHARCPKAHIGPDQREKVTAPNGRVKSSGEAKPAACNHSWRLMEVGSRRIKPSWEVGTESGDYDDDSNTPRLR